MWAWLLAVQFQGAGGELGVGLGGVGDFVSGKWNVDTMHTIAASCPHGAHSSGSTFKLHIQTFPD